MRRSVGFLLRCRARMLVVAVTAMSVGACTSTSEVGQGDGASPSAQPAVGEVTISQPAWLADGSDWALSLTWDPPRGASMDHYEVWRNGRLREGRIVGLAWTDPRVQPGRQYDYEVRAITTDGQQILPSNRSIETASPAVAEARLEGRLVVKLQEERSSGIDPIENGRVVFRFEPKCGEGACSVRWTVKGHPNTQVTLTRDGDRYRGDARTPLLIRNCFGNVVDEDVTVRFRVVSAESRFGRWLATAIVGTIAERSSWPGCMEASIRWNVTSVPPNER